MASRRHDTHALQCVFDFMAKKDYNDEALCQLALRLEDALELLEAQPERFYMLAQVAGEPILVPDSTMHAVWTIR